MKLTLFTSQVIFDRFIRKTLCNINSFANISVQGHLILNLFVLIGKTTCQITKKSVIASLGMHLVAFLLFFKTVQQINNCLQNLF